ncbi:MAG: hypothetical protein GXO77_06855 [Calditrichaeota bacterium]|nr:hypothetical protein [Calditrichota bacterium]
MRFLSANNVELLLHGHVHETAEYARRKIRILNGAGAVNSTVDNNFSFNLITANNGLSSKIFRFGAEHHKTKRFSDGHHRTPAFPEFSY